MPLFQEKDSKASIVKPKNFDLERDLQTLHELRHMKYKNHDAKFYTLLESKSPNWRKTKERLELPV